jgi:hypothetical protein
VRLRGIRLGDRVKDNLDLEKEKKDANKEFGERKKAIDSEIGVLKDAVREGVEMRQVDVEKRVNHYLGTVTLVRLDIGETIEHRAAYPEELQTEMNLGDEDEPGGGGDSRD